MHPPQARSSFELGGTAANLPSRRMQIDPQIAKALGFPKPEYMIAERERRWLCQEVPRNQVVQTETITDLYVSGSRLRLREARPIDGGAPMLRLSRKADIDIHTRLVTSIYLPEDEFAILAATLPGIRIKKTRYRLLSPPGVMMLVDEFLGDLAGLVMAEAEFKTPELLAAFPMPEFAVREVTEDPRFTGGYLSANGLPKDFAAD
jgi:CYTH domain-containing protein